MERAVSLGLDEETSFVGDSPFASLLSGRAVIRPGANSRAVVIFTTAFDGGCQSSSQLGLLKLTLAILTLTPFALNLSRSSESKQ